MSKISEESWMVETLQAYWKRFAASGIGFAHRYRSDFFLRTEINIIALQVAYAGLIIALLIGSLVVLYHEVIGGVGAAIATALTSTTTPFSSAYIAAQLEAVRTREIVGVSSIVVLVAAVFGFLVARFALAPARNALASQKQFIGNVAHELRTPLAIIKTNTEVRLLEPSLPKSAREVHESNLEELDRISDIINNLLSLNALVRPESIPFDRVDLGKIAERVVERFSDLAHKKHLRARVEIGRERLAWGNAVALEQITMNLVRNALHHTSTGSVTVSIDAGSHGELELVVADTGHGIASEDLLHIFEPFFRGDRARSRSGGAGSGLGLAIVSELVKLHSGRVSIRSAVGKGTSVIVTLPSASKIQKNISNSETAMHEVSADFSKHRTLPVQK